MGSLPVALIALGLALGGRADIGFTGAEVLRSAQDDSSSIVILSEAKDLVPGVPEEPPSPSAPAGAPIVRAVELRSDAPIARPEELRDYIAIEPGDPLTETAVRRSLRNLAASGLATEVECYVEPRADGVAAIFALWAAVQIEAIAVEGELGLDRDRLLAVVPAGADQPLVEDRVLRGVYKMQDLLHEQGYRDAEVRLAVTVDEPRKQARVTYRVTAGSRARIGAVSFTGDLGPFPPVELARALRAGSGELYLAANVREDGERLQRWLVKRDYRLAEVEPAIESYDPALRRVDLDYRLQVGPKVVLDVRGAERQELEKHDLLPFLAPGGYDEALMLQAVGRIKSWFQGKGYYKVAVARREERRDGELVVTLAVDKGALLELTEVGFRGEKAFSASELARRMTTAPRRLLTPKSGRLVDEVLADDLANLRSFYMLQGYSDVKIGPPEIVSRGRSLELIVPVREGERHSVGTLVLEGVEALSREKLLAALPLRSEGPFHRLLLDQSVDTLRAEYERQGYGDALASATVAWHDDHLRADVQLRVLEGTRTVVDRVLVRGNDRTRAAVVRHFAQLPPDTPFSRERLLEAEQRLYKLGIFSRVDVHAAPAESSAPRREVLVDVEEGKTMRTSYGAGWDSEHGARGLFSYVQSNVWGRAATFQVDLLASQKEERYRVLLRQPLLGSVPAEVTTLAYHERENRPAFDVRRRGVRLDLQRVTEDLRLGTLFDYRLVDTDVFDPLAVIPPQNTAARVASLSPYFYWDRRNDPIEPSRGWSVSSQVEYAFPALSANAEFVKLFAQGTAYRPLLGGTLAGSLRGGAIEPLRSQPAGVPIRAVVPPSELFYAGGSTSHRAYERDTLGIAGETVDYVVRGPGKPLPLGGGGLLLANLDWRFPIAAGLGGTLFVDAGNVWADWRHLDPRDAKIGLGVGVRYMSPVGPLRFDVGWKVDPEPGESRWVWFFTLGNPF